MALQPTFTMKPMLLLPILLFTFTVAKAQKVYTVEYQSQADVKGLWCNMKVSVT